MVLDFIVPDFAIVLTFIVNMTFPSHTHLLLLSNSSASFVSNLSRGNCDSQFSIITC